MLASGKSRLTRAQIEYAALDARMALLVYEELRRRLAEQGRLEAALRASEVLLFSLRRLPGIQGALAARRDATRISNVREDVSLAA